MSDPISTFFDAWQITTEAERTDQIASAVSEDIRYDDPRTPDTVEGIAALSKYVGMFSANAPGWSARVVTVDTVAGMSRATVAFGGKGPDGGEMVQHGQYFIEMDGERITRMIGFAGTGAPVGSQ